MRLGTITIGGCSLCLIAGFAVGQVALGQHSHTTSQVHARSPRETPMVLTATSLKTEGLRFGDAILKLYLGDFADMPITRTGAEFSNILGGYLTMFSKDCHEALPANKVPITTDECVRYERPVNGLGAPVGQEYCVEEKPESLPGQYADPGLFKAFQRVEKSANAEFYKSQLPSAAHPTANPLEAMNSVLDKYNAAEADMGKLLHLNACASPALRRLENNMILFANEKEPIQLGGKAVVNYAPGDPNAADLVRLAGDLVKADSTSWLFNKYDDGLALSRSSTFDSQGYPLKLTAIYRDKGLTGTGSVTISFVDGVPACLYFADAPSHCKAPNVAVVQAYRAGKYATTPH